MNLRQSFFDPTAYATRKPRDAQLSLEFSKTSSNIMSHNTNASSRPIKLRPRIIAFFVVLLLASIFLVEHFRQSVREHQHLGRRDVRGCRHKDMTVRREWSSLTLPDRVAFTDAVNCLFNSPSKLDPKIYPGAQNRFDDFVALHVNNTLTIHFTGFFLPWHRHFLHIWHLALKNECGFKGELPYWDWPKYAHNIYDNLLFDGSAGSISGDGKYNPNNTGVELPTQTLPIGKGGGCIESGPFKGRSMNLGPYSFDLLEGDSPTLPSDAFAYNPRCLSRDLNPQLARLNHNKTTVHSLIFEPQTMADFHLYLSRSVNTEMVNNPHAGGHFLYGGAGRDFFASNADPVFYLHHAQVDRIWAKWQALDPKNRQYALEGTHTIFNRPPSLPVTLDDYLDMGFEDDGKTLVKHTMSKNGPLYCYRYDDE